MAICVTFNAKKSFRLKFQHLRVVAKKRKLTNRFLVVQRHNFLASNPIYLPSFNPLATNDGAFLVNQSFPCLCCVNFPGFFAIQQDRINNKSQQCKAFYRADLYIYIYIAAHHKSVPIIKICIVAVGNKGESNSRAFREFYIAKFLRLGWQLSRDFRWSNKM